MSGLRATGHGLRQDEYFGELIADDDDMNMAAAQLASIGEKVLFASFCP